MLATDISPVMVETVAEHARAAGLAHLRARVAAAEEVAALEDAPFDAAICRMGLMLLPDRPGALAAVRQALRPGGRFAGVVFASPAANPFMTEPLVILRRHASKAAPPPGAPGIFALADRDALDALLGQAGFTDVAIRTLDQPLTMRSADEAVRMIRDAFGVYRAIIADQPAEIRESAWAEVAEALHRFEGPDGLSASARVHVFGCMRPAV